MGLFDIFTGNAYKEAAEKQRQYLTDISNRNAAQLGQARETGLEALRSGQAGALGAVGPGIAQARGDITGYLDPAIAALYGLGGRATTAITGAQTPALEALRSGVLEATGPLGAAAGRYGAAGTQASQMSADALGLNGPEGIARAKAAFQAGPGYEFGLNQGLESIIRQAAAGGSAAGGNVLQESQKFGQGLANQEYDKWRSLLAGREGLYAPLERGALSDLSQAFLTGGTGAANILTGTGQRLADIYSGVGKGAADIYGATGRSLADLASRGGLAEADIYGRTGPQIADLVSKLAGVQSQFTGQIAPQYSGTYGTEAAATTGGSANLWNLLGGGAKFVAGGGLGQLSSGLSSLGSMFK